MDTDFAKPKVKQSKIWTLEEIAKHNTEEDCWIILHGWYPSRIPTLTHKIDVVFDVTTYMDDHPGGGKMLVKYGGNS